MKLKEWILGTATKRASSWDQLNIVGLFLPHFMRPRRHDFLCSPQGITQDNPLRERRECKTALVAE